MEGILFSNLNEIVKNQEDIHEIQRDDVWGIMQYEAGRVKGNALITTEIGFPKDLILQPKLTGWYKIFIASNRIDGGFSLHVKFDNEKHFTIINNTANSPKTIWWRNESMEEIFWCCADLTDREIIVHKHHRNERITMLSWLRFVPMTEEEIAAYKEYVSPDRPRNLHVHFDNDTNHLIGTASMEDMLLLNYTVKDTDAKICTQEIMDDYHDEAAYDERDRALDYRTIRYNNENRKAAAMMDDIVKARLDLMHGMGVKLYAGFRVSMARNTQPWTPLMFYSIIKNPAYYVHTRDGRVTPIASYAYPEVRRYAIDYIKRAVKRGYDGVSLITHRGAIMGFEKPVLDEFARRYDGLDACRVPLDDPRLTGIWCEFFAMFVRELHTELDAEMGRHIPINVITGFSPEAAKRMSVDIEMLCKEGLIDHFCAEAMDHFEVLGDSLGEDGLIDLEKYKDMLTEDFIVKRCFWGDWNRVKDGTPRFAEIAEKYGVEFFAGMNPSGGNAEQRIEWLSNLRALGAKSFSFFNYCHDGCRDRTIVHTAGKPAHTPVPEFYTPHFYRVLSLDGIDMSTFVPGWRG